jgi:hypothetical protein
LARNDGFGCLIIESEICAIGHPTSRAVLACQPKLRNLAGVEEDHQPADKPQFYGSRKPGVPLGIPSQCFTISVRIRFVLNLRDQELLSSIPCECPL